MRTFGLIVALTLTGLIFAPPTASACTAGAEFRSKTSGSWNSTSTWEICAGDGINWEDPEPGDYPRINDDATILRGHTVDVGGLQAIDRLEIQAGAAGPVNPGVLEMKSGTAGTKGVLTMNDILTQQLDPTYGDGKIEFTGASTYPGELVVNWSMPAAGLIEVLGTTGGKITVNGSYVLTISGTLTVSGGPLAMVANSTAGITVSGTLDVSGADCTFTGGTLVLDTPGDVNVTGGDFTVDGLFDHDGDLTISGSNTVTVEIKGTGVDVGSQGDWILNNPNATLLLNHDDSISVTGTGKFDLTNGMLKVNRNFTFAGCLEWKNDAIIDCDNMDGGDKFRAYGNCQ